ncbi:MAG: BrnT family toxin [Cyanobacteria bacterium P01_H01_bin.35]
MASTVFNDPYQLTIYDEEHSQDEDRWITIGLDETGILRVVVHTLKKLINPPISLGLFQLVKLV